MIASLRVRLALAYAASVLFVLALFGAFLYGLVRYQLVRHHDGALRDAYADVTRVISEHEDCADLTADQRSRLDAIGRIVLFHEVGGGGRLLYRSPDLAGVSIDSPETVAAAGSFATVQGTKGPYRVFAAPYRARSGRRGVIHVAAPLGDVPAPLKSLRQALLLTAPAAALLAALGGYWFAARALRPVDDVTRLAREIGATSLGRRLPATGSMDEMGRLVATFNGMIGRLESSFEAMKRFTADASHELRGPLSSMRGAIDVTLNRPREAEAYRATLVSVGEDVDHVRSLVDDLLVLARADAGRIPLDFAPTRLDVLLSEVAESLRPLSDERDVALAMTSGPPVEVAGDERWLRQLFFNLIENGVKFSAGSKDARVTMEVSTRAGLAEVRVRDNGPGMSAEARAHAFERFFRADAARTRSGGDSGTGLGLSIAQWVADAHGGTIAIEADDRGGTCFVVGLPVRR